MESDGGGSALDLWRMVELLVPTALSVVLAWCLFRAERRAQRRDARFSFVIGFYERTYTQMHEALASASQKLTEAVHLYSQGRPGKPSVDSAGHDLRHALSLAMAIEARQKPALRDALQDLNDFLESVPNSKPLRDGDSESISLNALAKKVKNAELDVLRYMTSGDMVRDVEGSVAKDRSTAAREESATSGIDAKSPS